MPSLSVAQRASFCRTAASESPAGMPACGRALATVCGDHEINPVALAGITSEQRADDPLIVRMSKYGYDAAPALLRADGSCIDHAPQEYSERERLRAAQRGPDVSGRSAAIAPVFIHGHGCRAPRALSETPI